MHNRNRRTFIPIILAALAALAGLLIAAAPADAQTLEVQIRNVTHDVELAEGIAWTHPALSEDLHAEDPPPQPLMDLSDSSLILPFAALVESRGATAGLVFVEGLLPGERATVRIPTRSSSARVGYSVLLPLPGGGYAYLASHTGKFDPPARELGWAWESLGFRHLPRATHLHRAHGRPVLQTVADWTSGESESDSALRPRRNCAAPAWGTGHPC
ncbi:MAG: hypothetical protein OXI22_00850 [Defluviicoccus sp.]|nr:hypothetical protein [Defluviicoccus sp.]